MRFLLKTIFLLLPAFSFSQILYSPCKDSLKIEDIYFTCYEDYKPVCACDGITYRTPCSAENQYAISSGNFLFGPCTAFDYDISPNQVYDILRLKIVKKTSGYFTIVIYDTFGHIFFTQDHSYNEFNLDPKTVEIPLSNFYMGLYIIEVIADGEAQRKKFFKVY